MLETPAEAFKAPQTLLSNACAHMLAGRVGEAFGQLCRAVAAKDAPPTAAPLLSALIERDAHLAEQAAVDPETLALALARVLDAPELASAAAGRLAQQMLKVEFAALAQSGQTMSLDALPVRCKRLMLALLRKELVTDLELEAVLRALRAALLRRFAPLGGPSGYRICTESMRYIEGFALHGFRNEFLWPETAEESEQVAHLAMNVEHHLSSGARPDLGLIALLGAYRPLYRSPFVRQRARELVEGATGAVLRRVLLDPIQEETIAEKVASLTPIAVEGASEAVRAQYEANPYPRWAQLPSAKPRPLAEILGEEIAPNAISHPALPDAPSVLVAGCGSGRTALMAARRISGARVLGVDLSRASLAYAWRQAMAMEIENVAFAQADILTLDQLDAQFDLIDAVGVLHHMAEPELGLKRLIGRLKPQGVMQLGFYSARARAELAALRAVIRTEGLKPDLAGLRALRAHYALRLRAAAPMAGRSEDFYSASGLRDLVFNVCEHEYALPQIEEMLARAGLEFLGFIGLPEGARARYAAFAPLDPAQTDLTAWDAFEAREPALFQGLYRFWCRPAR